MVKRIKGSYVLLLVFFLPFLFTNEVRAEKRIEVNLTTQRLHAYDNETKKFDFIISSGKPWWPTPTGEFKPWIRLRSTRMRGGSVQNGTYYNLANVPYVFYFYNQTIPKHHGYAIHGTYWHNNFGRPMSHGCINLKISDAKLLYDWIDTNTMESDVRIIISGVTPKY